MSHARRSPRYARRFVWIPKAFLLLIAISTFSAACQSAPTEAEIQSLVDEAVATALAEVKAGPPSGEGSTSEQGEVGPQGELGPTGLSGSEGPIGPVGLQGPQGEPGRRGLSGPEGPQGEQGLQGIRGEQGLQGLQGLAGPQGPSGSNNSAGISQAQLIEIDNKIDDLRSEIKCEVSGSTFCSSNLGSLFSSSTLDSRIDDLDSKISTLDSDVSGLKACTFDLVTAITYNTYVIYC